MEFFFRNFQNIRKNVNDIIISPIYRRRLSVSEAECGNKIYYIFTIHFFLQYIFFLNRRLSVPEAGCGWGSGVVPRSGMAHHPPPD